MAFKFIILFGFLAAANAGHISHGYVSAYAPSVHKTIEYTAPTVHKTIEYAAPVAKTIEYAAPVAKSIEYAAPTVHKTIEYAAPVAKTIEYAAPVTKTIYQPSPAYTKPIFEPEYNYQAYAPSTYSHGTLSHYGKTIATPHSYVNKYDSRYVHDDAHYKVAYPSAYQTVVKTPTVVKSVAPVIPTLVKSVAPVVPTVVKSYDGYDQTYNHGAYAHSSPVITKTAAVSYSPAVAVSHATFESAHGHYAW